MSTQALRTHWPGWHYDARTAKWEPVTVMIGAAGIGLVTEDGRVLFWPFEELRQTRGASAHEPVRFERGDEAPDAVVVDDPAFLPAVHAAAPYGAPPAAPPSHTDDGSAPASDAPPAPSPRPPAAR